MGNTLDEVGAITMFVADRARSKEFYGRVFASEPIFENDVSVAFRVGQLVVNLLERSAAPDLIGPASVAGAGAPATYQLTLGVDDTDAACAMLAERSVSLVNGPLDRAWGLRTALFSDPDGHLWEIASPIVGWTRSG